MEFLQCACYRTCTFRVCMYNVRTSAPRIRIRAPRSQRACPTSRALRRVYIHAFATTYESEHTSYTIDIYSRLHTHTHTHLYISISDPSHHQPQLTRHPAPLIHPPHTPHPIHAPISSPPPPPHPLSSKTAPSSKPHIPISCYPHASRHPNPSSKKHVLSSSHSSPPRMARHRSRRPRRPGKKTLGKGAAFGRVEGGCGGVLAVGW